MDIKTFQDDCKRTMNNDTFLMNSLNCCLGISGESGELIDIIKKSIFQGHEIDKGHLIEEMGDLLFYICSLANTYNINMDKVIMHNINKRLERYPDGFTIENSKRRKDKNGRYF